MNNIVKSTFLNALATAAYVVAVATFIFYAPRVFGRANTVFVPVAMLLLLVFSAALTGSLILGRPALWYLDGRKKEALTLLIWTLAIFLAITLLALSLLLLNRTV